MKNCVIIFAWLLCGNNIYAQQKTPAKTPPVPCNGSADGLPGQYYDHTQPKYPTNLSGYATQDKAAMTKQMIVLEKTEEASRNNFQLSGCVARVSFSTLAKNSFGGYFHAGYQYQLALYQNVCHVTEHIVKTVDEYRSVLRISVNPDVAMPSVLPGAAGEFYLTDKNKSVRYEIPINAKLGPNYEKDRATNPSRISQYISESTVLANRSSDYKNKHRDFLKIINGEGYVENWMTGSEYDKPRPGGYKWIDRRYLITKPGVPLLIPVTRKQYLEDLLEYFEIEKVNFYISLEAQLKSVSGNTSDNAKKRMVVLEADKAAYPQFYEERKAKVTQLLATQKADWLQKNAVVDYNSYSYDAYQRLADIGKFYDAEGERTAALYIYNPEYFKINDKQPIKPILFEIQLRYESGEDRGFSERYLANFVKNYDFDALRKMLQ
ncbi:MAG: hypothetical protein QM731_26105 [Chitinophagaceae bacterium]